MKRILDLATLPWTVSGWAPGTWPAEGGRPEVSPVAAKVPGTVQIALREAGLLPDWNVGLSARNCEWVENRQWLYEVTLPAGMVEAGRRHLLRCEGLDWKCGLYVNGHKVARIEGAHAPVVLDLTGVLGSGENRLQLHFDCPPRWLGRNAGAMKPRFSYDPHGSARLVSIGPWDAITLESDDGEAIADLSCWTSIEIRMDTGNVYVRGRVEGERARRVRVVLRQRQNVIHEERFAPEEFEAGVSFRDIPVRFWWPNMAGSQDLYRLTVELLDGEGQVLDSEERPVGFKHVAWQPCEGSPEDAEPWLCVINGRPIYLQGVDWLPIRPNFADVTASEYRQRLELYRDLGVNTLRVSGDGILEKACFYEICDELGLLVWQELPGRADAAIARSDVTRRAHHVSLLMWGGEAAHAGVIDELDPTRRYVAGPLDTLAGAFGAPVDLADWATVWYGDEAPFRLAAGQAGASGADLIEIHAGGLDPMPVHPDNPLWGPAAGWGEGAIFQAEHGRAPNSLFEYVAWSQRRQAEALAIAARAARSRFPRTGGLLLSFGHDRFPCPASPAILDFWGRPKPAALALKDVWHSH